MGIDIHNLNFLRYSAKARPLGNTITIGRQGLHAAESTVRKLVGTKSSYRNQQYCEQLLIEYLGSTSVDSIDNSDYESATHVHDMNNVLPDSLYGKYDTVIDGGCLEHIYNVPQALKNCSLLCKPGGQILHMVPTNNLCGHGFWQFSPELFFSLYSGANGYTGTEVFIADLTDTKRWFQVRMPNNGKRVNVHSSTELYVLARTTLAGGEFSHASVQQSDYQFEWEKSSARAQPMEAKPPGIRDKLKKVRIIYRTLSPMHRYLLSVRQAYLNSRVETGLNGKNPGLTVQKLQSFI